MLANTAIVKRALGMPALLRLTLLILAGEGIFVLPFHVARFFRPTLLAGLEMSQLQLGVLQSAYGLAALLSYFPGGLIADRFSARTLLSLSLFLTGIGGFYFATLPSFAGLMALHLYWGVTTILLFWAPLIRATRLLGGSESQGASFGILESGRGLLAALLATVGVSLLSSSTAEVLSTESRREALTSIISVYSWVTVGLGLLIWLCFRAEAKSSEAAGAQVRGMSQLEEQTVQLPTEQADSAVERPRVRILCAHGVVILAAYCLYKSIDFYSTYAAVGFGLSEAQSAQVATLSVWLRPFSAFLFGYLADRVSGAKLAASSFIALMGFYILGALSAYEADSLLILGIIVGGTSIFVYGFRVLYYSLLKDSGVPMASTGAAVGLISLFGYTPDFFFPTLSAWLVQSAPGAEGYQRLFLSLAAWSLLGLFAVWLMKRLAIVSK